MSDITKLTAPELDQDCRLISEVDFDKLCRAQRAADLLGALSTAVCESAGISVDHIAAVADLIHADLCGVLDRTQFTGAQALTASNRRGTDHA